MPKTRVDYDKLARDVTAAQLASPNLDNDPLTKAQKRGADLIGRLAAFMQSEVDRVTDGEEPLQVIPLEVLSAMFANQALNVVRSTSDPRAATTYIVMDFARRVMAMVDRFAEEDIAEAGTILDKSGTVMAASVEVSRETVQ